LAKVICKGIESRNMRVQSTLILENRHIQEVAMDTIDHQ
jgi:hypothetical protein